MTRFACNGIPARCAGLVLAGSILLLGSPASSGAPAVEKKPSATTRKVVGWAIDADGRPIAGAVVCLTREDKTAERMARPIVLAQSESGRSGRFELCPLDSEIKKVLAEPDAVFELWIQKSGLALSHSTLSGDPSSETHVIALKGESRFTLKLRDGHGSPSANVAVEPSLVLLPFDRWVIVPEPIVERLKTHSTSDGRVALRGFDGRGQTLTIGTPETGVQCLSIGGTQRCPLPVTLQKTRVFKLRLIPPHGQSIDFAHSKISMTAFREEENRSHCSKGGSKAVWHVASTPSADGSGEFTMPNQLGHGTLGYRLDLQSKTPLVPAGTRLFNVTTECVKTALGTAVVVHCFLPIRRLSGICVESTFRIETALPLSLGLLKAAWERKGGDLQLAMRMRKGVVVKRIFRDASTKRPLEGIPVVLLPTGTEWQVEDAGPWMADLTRLPLASLKLVVAGAKALHDLKTLVWPDDDLRDDRESDAQGIAETFATSGRSYEYWYELPEHDRCERAWTREVIQIPSGVDRLELKPIDVIRGRTIEGSVLDCRGTPLHGIRVRATYRVGEQSPKHKPSPEICLWTTTDGHGKFRFESLAAGATVTIVSVRDDIPLAGPIEVTATDQPIRLQERICELVSLSGRILGIDDKAIAGVELVVEAERSPDPARSFRTTTGEDGSFHTSANSRRTSSTG